MAGVAEALAADDPLPLLGLASTLLSAFDDGPSLGWPHEPALPTRDDLWQTFFDRVDPVNYDRLVVMKPPAGVAAHDGGESDGDGHGTS